MKKPKPKAHPLCRPPRGADGPIDILLVYKPRPLQLTREGRWRYDNGEPSLAFIGHTRVEGGRGFQNVAWVARCKCTDATCPRFKALEHAREKLDIESLIVIERPPVRR